MLFTQYKADKTKEIIFRLSKKYIKGNCLDMGAGSGSFVQFLKNKGFDTVGIDIEPPSNAQDVVQMDAADMTYINKFDTVFMNDFLEHIQFTKEILRKAYLSLKTNGHIIVICLDSEDLNKNMTCCPNCGTRYHKNYHFNSYTKQSLARELNRAGFIIETEKSVAMHFNKYMTGWPFTKIVEKFNRTKSLFVVGVKI